MRAILLAITVLMSFFILVALIKEKPVQQQEIAIVTESLNEELQEPVEIQEPTFEKQSPQLDFPQPIIIDNQFDVSKIDDISLRNTVRLKTDFRRQKVLYFVWKGSDGERMEGKMQDNVFAITLFSKLEASLMIHKQVFIIPANADFSVEIAQK